VEHFRQYQRFAGGAGAREGGAEADKAAAALAASVLDAPDATALALLVSGKEKLQDPAWSSGVGGGSSHGSDDSSSGCGGGNDDANERATRTGLLAKFRQWPALKAQLVALQGKTLVCLSDDLWGGISMRSGLPEGKNRFGKLLMAVRDELCESAGSGAALGGESGGPADATRKATSP
jgi:hypothetical protein